MSDAKLLAEAYDVVQLYNTIRTIISKVPKVEVITFDNTPKALRVTGSQGAVKFLMTLPRMGKDEFQIGVPVEMVQTMLKQRKAADFSLDGKTLVIKEARFTGELTTVAATPWQATKVDNAVGVPEELLIAVESYAQLNRILEGEVLLASGQDGKATEVAVFDRLHFCFMRNESLACPPLYLPLDVFKAMSSISSDYNLSVTGSRAIGFSDNWFYALPFVQTLTAKIEQVKGLATKEAKPLGRVDANDMRAAVADAWSSSSFIVSMEGKNNAVSLSTTWKAGKVVAEVNSAKVRPFNIGVDLRPLNDILTAMDKDIEVIELWLADNILLLKVETPNWDITYGTITVQLQA